MAEPIESGVSLRALNTFGVEARAAFFASVRDVLMGKLAKRGVDPRLLDFGKPEKIGGDKLKQVVKVRNGIDSVLAKKIVAMIKESKLKVSSSIQGDAVRVTGAKRDTLQEAIALLRKDVTEVPLTFENFRD